MKKYIIFLILFVFTTASFAAEKFPHGCRVSGLRFSKNSLLFFSQHTAKPRIYAIHNISNTMIFLTHDRKNWGAGAGWDSELQKNHWSAILITRRIFNLHCERREKSGRVHAVLCSHLIRACQLSDFYSKNPIAGGFWVTENVLFNQLESNIRKRDIVLSY